MEPAVSIFCIYSMFYSDIVRKSLVGCKGKGKEWYIGSMTCNILLYADEIVLLSPTVVVNSLVMKFNTTKSVTLIFVPYKNPNGVWTIHSLPLHLMDVSCLW